MKCKWMLLILFSLGGSKVFSQLNPIEKLVDGLYSGEKQAFLSTAAFFVNIKGDTAYLEQFREFGGVLYRDLLDTLVRTNEKLYSGNLTLLLLKEDRIYLLNNNQLKWKLKVNMSYNNLLRGRAYSINQNRLLLDSLDFKNLSTNEYRPLVDKAFIMNHDSFLLEVEKFKIKYFDKIE